MSFEAWLTALQAGAPSPSVMVAYVITLVVAFAITHRA